MGILVHPALVDRVLEWRLVSARIGVIRIKLKDRTLALVQVYAPNTASEYKSFLDELLPALGGTARNESIVLMGEINAHVGDDAYTWSGVIGRHGDARLN